MGSLAQIFISSAKTVAPISVQSVQAVAGRGLEGDRYFLGAGTFSKKADPGNTDPGNPDPSNEVTLVESEALEALRRDYSIDLDASEIRRNLLTEGVALNHLVGREFSVGAARLEGLRLCEPCGHLEKLTIDGVEKGLRHRGGLRARVVQGGMIQAGDSIS